MKRPFVFMSIPLIIGIIVSYYLNINTFPIILLLIFSIGIFALNLIKEKSNFLILFFVFLLLGIGITNLNLNNSILDKRVNKNIILKGKVQEVLWQNNGEGKYIIKINSIIDEKSILRVKEKTVLKVFGQRHIELGDEITFKGQLKIPLENTNPKLFNYRLSLLTNKIYTSITIKDYSIMAINSSNKSFKDKIKINFYNRIENIFDSNLKEVNSSLMKSIILGEYSYLDDENISKYRDLGLAHILAVSGLHIGIITGFLIFLLAHLGINRKVNIAITLSIIWIYGYILGFPPSLLRANIIFSIVFYAQLSAEAYDSINNIFLAMFILLIINPMWIFNLGFQLSFIATISIVYFTPIIQAYFYGYRNRITDGLSPLLSVLIGLLPIQAYYFNKVSVFSIFANLIIAPILSLALIIGGSMVGLSYIIPILNPILGKILDLLLSIQFLIIHKLHNFSFGIMKIFSPNLLEILIYYILVLVIFKAVKIDRLRKSIKNTILYSLIFLILFIGFININDKSIEIHFIDVGQGDCILIRARNGDYLIDTGGNIFDSFDIGKNITLPYLQKHGVSRLKAVFITHFHDDHCKSLPLLMDNIKIDNILLSYKDNNNYIFNEIINSGISTTILKEKDKINLDNNTWINVLGPSKDLIKDSNENNKSLVFLLTHYDKTVLFTGDMEKESESRLASSIEDKVDIIKVPHHGSNTSSTGTLLNKIKPEIAVISLGRNNFFGHPSKDVIGRYEDIGSTLYRTDTMGRVNLRLDKGKITVDPYIKEKISLINFIDDNLLMIVFYALYYLVFYIFIKEHLYLEEELIFYGL